MKCRSNKLYITVDDNDIICRACSQQDLLINGLTLESLAMHLIAKVISFRYVTCVMSQRIGPAKDRLEVDVPPEKLPRFRPGDPHRPALARQCKCEQVAPLVSRLDEPALMREPWSRCFRLNRA